MTAPDFDYDLVILGGGSAGIVSGVLAGSLGLRTLLVEKNRMGGECLNTGCIPSKALIHAAKVASLINRAAEVGIEAPRLSIDDAADVMTHVRDMIGVVRDADATEQLLQDSGVTIRHGSARFLDPDTLEMNGETIRAEHFILATGSRPARPAIPGLWESGALTNEEVFSLQAPPPSLLVLGGGPIGVELAQAFHRLGSRVTLVEKLDRLLPHDDLEAAKLLEQELGREGLTIQTSASLQRVETVGSLKRATIQRGGAEETLDVAVILVAVGRQPNVEGLDLDRAGVRLHDSGVVVDRTLHTTGPRVWAAGDVTGKYQFSHIAEHEAKLVVQNLFLPVRQRAKFRVVPWTTFTDPEVAHVGLTEEEAKQQGIRYEVCRQPFTQDDRALVEGEGVGFVKILTTRWTGRILGVHIVGPRAGELIQEFVLATQHGLTVRDIADTIHVYPTLTIASQRAAQRWYEARSQEPAARAALREYLRFRPHLPQLAAAGASAFAAGALACWLATRKS